MSEPVTMTSSKIPAVHQTQRRFADQRSELLFILSFYSGHTRKAVLVLLIMLISNGLSLAFPKYIGDMMDGIQVGGLSISVWSIVGILMGLFTVQALVNYFTSVSLTTITENVLAGLRTRLFDHIVRLPMSFFGEKRVGDLLSRITSDLGQIQETFTFTLMQLLRQSIFLVGGIVLILFRSIQLTTPVLLTLPVLIVVAVVFGRRLRKLSTKVQDVLAQSTTIAEESLQAIESVKSFTNELFEVRRYSERLSAYVGLAISGARLRSIFFSFIMFSMFGGIAGVLAYGVHLVYLNQLSIGELISFILYAFFVAGALGSFAELYGQIQRSLGASVRIREILNESVEDLGMPTATTTLHSIRLENVTFSYPARPDVPVLNNLTMSIHRGARVAFVGESGAGKSTTASMLQRFYEPQSGALYYDEVEARHLSLTDIRRSIAIVPQDVILFGSTIEENIRYGNVNTTMDQVWKAADLANASEFIRSFPDGMQTLVGERGIKLSGGQRQRIAIARAMLKNAPILILDEATSSLDSQTEFLIQEALENLMRGRTTIIIAHRLSTIRRCDTIFVFSKGRVVEQGRHEELLAVPKSLYARFCELQFGSLTLVNEPLN